MQLYKYLIVLFENLLTSNSIIYLKQVQGTLCKFDFEYTIIFFS